jgi:hypothetical protein
MLLVLLVLVRILMLFGHSSLLLLAFPPLIPSASLLLLLVSSSLKVVPRLLSMRTSVLKWLSSAHSTTSQTRCIGRHRDRHPLLDRRSLVI